MSGQTDLAEVLQSLQVSCDGVEYAFATVQDNVIPEKGILGTFRESEGLTVIATKEYLEEKTIPSQGTYAKLTIEIHTSLELVGLTAVLARKLADEKISANVIAAYYHDHIFVQYDLRHKAIELLLSLKSDSR